MPQTCVEKVKIYTNWLQPPKPHFPYNVSFDGVRSGLRCDPFLSCQYWCNCLPGKCEHWDEATSSCTVVISVGFEPPSSYNNGHCDFLGRASMCSQYSGDVDADRDKFFCILPDPFRSGVIKPHYSQVQDGVDSEGNPVLKYIQDGIKTSVPKTDITSYNDGKCDGKGTGRISGYGTPSICSYYRPFHMGFGVIEPKSSGIIKDDTGIIVELNYNDESLFEYFDFRLPLYFQIRNLMARLQPCAYFNNKYGLEFNITYDGVELPDTPICNSNSSVAQSFVTINELGDTIYKSVWSSQAKCIVCNGAKPECPFYTGKWFFCLDRKMDSGDHLSAQQYMELMFWLYDWKDKEQIADVLKVKPNEFNDKSTDHIYTYQWYASINGTESAIFGKDISLCGGAPFWFKEFAANPPTDYNFLSNYNITIPPYKSATATEDSVSFPTLLRDITKRTDSSGDLYFNTLQIIYPYPSKMPFDKLKHSICDTLLPEDTICVHRTFSEYGIKVAVIGATKPYTNIYVINLNSYPDIYKGKLPKEFSDDSYESILNIAPELRPAFFSSLDKVIETIIINAPKSIYTTVADGFGGFYVENVDLEYSKVNTIIVVGKFSAGAPWEFKKVKVWPQWYGGVIVQCDTDNGLAFNHVLENGHYLDIQDEIISPPATVNGRVIPLQANNTHGCVCSIGSLIKANSRYVYFPTGEGLQINYCFKKVTVTGKICTNWIRFDGIPSSNSGILIYAEISDLNLSYQYSWEVISAKMTKGQSVPSNMEEWVTEPFGNVCSECPTDWPFNKIDDVGITNVELEVVIPNATIPQSQLPPNACVLIVKNPNYNRVGFSKLDDWTLTVDYYYTKIDNSNVLADGEEFIWPDFSDTFYRYYEPKWNIVLTDNIFNISNITNETVGILSQFLDEDGRIISTFATKMAVQIPVVKCRSYEIYYNSKSSGPEMRLEPSEGWITEPYVSKPTGIINTVIANPPCGDHDSAFFTGIGPMWFPFSACLTKDYYDVWAGAAYCTMPHENTPRYDYRFKGPIRNSVSVTNSVRGWLQACAGGWIYFTTTFSDPIWIGYDNIRSAINPIYYTLQEWQQPPFGNSSREYVERFTSIDCNIHISYLEGHPAYKLHWMPMCIENKSLYDTFGAYSIPTDFDAFFYYNQFNFFRHSGLKESTVELKDYYSLLDTPQDYFNFRKNFNDVFTVHFWGRATYPTPLIDKPGYPFPVVSLYTLNQVYGLWAWPEFWKDLLIAPIETSTGVDVNAISSGVYEVSTLKFADFSRPPYMYDAYKNEHRLLMDEDEYTVVYTGPIFEAIPSPELEEEEDENQQVTYVLKKYPSLKIKEGGAERWFNFVYPTGAYYGGTADWKDENQGVVNGSISGDVNPYFATKDRGVWTHNDNCLFGPNYTTSIDVAEASGRFIYSGEEEEGKAYNRGVNVSIYKNRLDLLPYRSYIYRDAIFGGKLHWTSIDGGSGENNSDVQEFYNFSMPGTGFNFNKSSKYTITWNIIADPNNPPVEAQIGHCISYIKIPYLVGYVAADTDGDGIFDSFLQYSHPKYQIMVGDTVLFSSGSKPITPGDGIKKPRGISSTSKNVQGVATTSVFTPYVIEHYIHVSSDRMMHENMCEFKVVFENHQDYGLYLIALADGSSLGSQLDLRTRVCIAEYLSIVEEKLKVFERRYITSVAENVQGLTTMNLDGPNSELKGHLFWDNSGIYFPSEGYSDALVANDKIRSYFGSIKYPDKMKPKEVNIDYEVNDYTTALNAEENVQKILYDSARGLEKLPDGDGLNIYNIKPPIKYKQFFDLIDVDDSAFDSLKATFYSESLSWEKHYLSLGYTPGELWRPGGHIFTTNNIVYLRNCWWIPGPGDPHIIYEAAFKHVDHAGGFAEEVVNPMVSMYYLKKKYLEGTWMRRTAVGGLNFGDGQDAIAMAAGPIVDNGGNARGDSGGW